LAACASSPGALGQAAPPPAADAVVPPRLLPHEEVPYPAGASGEARVLLVVTVNADGTVRTARVSEGEEPFAASALSAVRSWRFEPASRAGEPIAATIRLEVLFRAPPGEGEEESASTPSEPGTSPPAGVSSAAPSRAATPPEPLEVTIKGEKARPMRSSLERSEVRQLPGTFGDPFRAIEVMPGVTPIISGLPFFYVRGAPPGNVGYFIDEVRVPYLYHVALGPSVIHPGMVERVDLYPGGYPARYGRYAGGIVAGETTAPRTEPHGEGNLRLFDVGALAEAGFADGRGTVLLGGRYSYTALIVSLIAKEAKLDYRDYQARVTYDVTPRDRVTLFGFGAYDLVGEVQDGTTNVLFGSEFYRLDLRYDHSFEGGSSIRAAVTLGFDQTKLGQLRNTQDRMVGLRLALNHPLSPRVKLRAGVDGVVDAYSASAPMYTDPDNPDTRRFDELFPARSDLTSGLHAELAIQPDDSLEVTPGVRVDYFRSAGASQVGIDPRISARVKVTDSFHIVHAYGLAHQPPAFVIPIPGLDIGKLSSGLQTSLQTSAGVEIDLPESTKLTANLFNNAFFDMTDVLGVQNRAGNRDDDFAARSSGRAYGFELFLHKKLTSRLGGFLSYTLSRSTRRVGRAEFPSAFDRTHVANAALAYNLGRNWRAGTRAVFYTGIPKNRRDVVVEGQPRTTSSDDRDPAFYRIDARLEKRWTFGSSTWLSVVLEMLNATLRKEILNGEEIGPISVPSIGLEGGF
jgi:TonB family protein